MTIMNVVGTGLVMSCDFCSTSIDMDSAPQRQLHQWVGLDRVTALATEQKHCCPHCDPVVWTCEPMSVTQEVETLKELLAIEKRKTALPDRDVLMEGQEWFCVLHMSYFTGKDCPRCIEMRNKRRMNNEEETSNKETNR